MVYYVILLLIILLITFVCYKKGIDIKTNKYYLLTVLGLLLLFLVLKHYKVCIDWLSYLKMFRLYHKTGFIEMFSVGRYEIGFKFIIYIFSHIINDFYSFLLFVSTVSFVPIYKYIKENSKDYFLSSLIFMTFGFYSLYFSAIRLSIALSILMLSIRYIKQHRPKEFIITVIIAGLFHKTAFIFLPVYFLYNLDLNEMKTKIILIGYIITFFIRGYIIKFVTNFIYANYTAEEYSTGGEKMLLLLLIILCVLLYYKSDLVKKHKVNNLYINMLTIGIYIQIFALEIGTLNRVVQYFVFPIMILVPSFFELDKYNKKKTTFIRYALIACFVVYFCYIVLAGKNFNEYYFIFS